MANVDVSGLIDDLNQFAAQVMHEAATTVLEACKTDCPVSTETPTTTRTPGTLRDSLHVEDVTTDSPTFGFAIVSDVEYAAYTDDIITSPHIIFAVYAKSLRFWWENGPVGPGIYAYKWVRHPGNVNSATLHWFASKNEQRFDDALGQAT